MKIKISLLQRIKFLTGALCVVVLLPLIAWLVISHQPNAHAAAPDATANDFTSLQSALAAAPNDGTNYDIEITADIPITAALTLPTNQKISLHSDATRRTLLRDPSYTGALITSPNTAVSTSELTITNLVLDGNKANVTAAASASMIQFVSGSKATLNIGNGAILRNAAIASGYGAAVYSYSNTNIYGDAIIENNSGQHGGAMAFRSAAATTPYTVNIHDDVKIQDNTSTSYGAGLLVWGQATTIKVNVYGRTTFRGNTGRTAGLGAIGLVDLDVYDDVLVTENTNTDNGGIIGIWSDADVEPPHVSVRDNVKVINNASGAHGAGLYLRAVTCEMSGNVEVSDNTAGTYGGGVIFYACGTGSRLDGNAKILNNKATFGGGLYIVNSTMTIGGNAEISGNVATGRFISADGQMGVGGVAVVGVAVNVTITDNVKITRNRAEVGSGGGIGVWRNVPNPALTISGAVQITDNYSAENGGGIFIEPQQNQSIAATDYEKMTVGPGVVFARNRAQAAYQIAAADIPLHDAQIATRSFTAPFGYGYNNYDINYTGGTQVFAALFDAAGGSAVSGQLVPVGGAATRPSDPARSGYRFVGWYLGDNLYDFGAVLMGDVWLVAKWEVIPLAPNSGVR
ncbi:MAG: InlB B-repeat-containing protein [Candidatus Nomurabacteria bacterium]|jgi:hypothetical protein|nr:InlB B-repeat-containing protein [Candidatus Nomurabacteria bacterium]